MELLVIGLVIAVLRARKTAAPDYTNNPEGLTAEELGGPISLPSDEELYPPSAIDDDVADVDVSGGVAAAPGTYSAPWGEP